MSTSDETAAEEPRQGTWWSKGEHDLFLQALHEHGRNWKKVAEVVGSRTVAQVRSRAAGEDTEPNERRIDKLAYENRLMRSYIHTLANVNLAFMREFKQAFQGEAFPQLLEQSMLLVRAFPPPYL